MEGICDNISSGVHSIEIYIGECNLDQSESTSFISGDLHSPSRLHIEEVRTDQQVTAGEIIF